MTTQPTTGPRRTTQSRYAVKRDRREHDLNRHGYLRNAGSSTASQLCEVLGQKDSARVTMPWVTLVLGSGCLQIGTGADGRKLARQVGRAFRDAPVPDYSSSPEQEALLFAESLVTDRLGSLDVPVPTLADDDEMSQAAPHLVLAASLLTRLFFEVKAAQPGAVSRWDDDVIAFDLPDPGSALDHCPDIADRARKHLVLARAALEVEGPHEFVAVRVRDLLDQVAVGLSGAHGKVELSLPQLRLVTEIAWYYLVGDKTMQPGWTDLLIRLMLRSDDPSVAGSRRPRPRFLNLKRLGKLVAELLEASTRRAWDRHAAAHGKRPESPSIYDAAAAVLWAQHDKASANDGPPGVPPAVAFVTSFDLELEMALWAQSDSRPFSIAVPMHMMRVGDDEEAELCWLLADVEPDVRGDWSDRLPALLRPARWRVLRSDFDPRELRKQPVVVHLNGCPLLARPDVNKSEEPWAAEMFSDLAELDMVDSGDAIRFIHAVTVDEYLALRQSEAELFWASEDRNNQALRKSRALPPDLTHDTSKYARFWMVLGVPVADPAIRHRVTSHLTIRRFRDEGVGSAPVSEESGIGPRPDAMPNPVHNDVNGVAVNKRIEDDDASMLHWLGLDVVHDGCEAFTQDLLHYADHVLKDKSGSRTPDTGCTLDDEEGAR
jgi:hypothetical protein